MTYLRTTQEVLDDAVARAASAFSRSNMLADPDVLDDVLAHIADQAAGTMRQFIEAMRTGRERDLPFPNAAVADLLAVVAALRAALNYTPTPTGPEVYDQMKAEDVSTPEGDQLRLHLLSTHCLANAATLSDRAARNEHEHEHRGPGTIRNHDPELMTWSPDRITRLLDDVPVDDGRAAYLKAAVLIFDRLHRQHTETSGQSGCPYCADPELGKAVAQTDNGALPTWAEMFPGGRFIYYEGDDPAGFAAQIKDEFGIDVTQDSGWGEYIPNGDSVAGQSKGFTSYKFDCPAQHLDAIYGSRRWRMGS